MKVEMFTAEEVRNYQENHMNEFVEGMLQVVVDKIKLISVTTNFTTAVVHMNRFVEVANDIFPEMVGSKGQIRYLWKVENILKDYGFTTKEKGDCLVISWKDEITLK